MSPTRSGRESRFTDAIVIGDGVIGLAIALELGDRGLRCRVVGARRTGIASTAAAGLLAPSVAELPVAVRPFFYRSLDAFPAFLSRLHAVDPTLATIDGVLEIPSNDDEPGQPVSSAHLLDQAALAGLEPALAHLPRAIFHPRDAAVDNVRLTDALARAVATAPMIDFVHDDPVAEIDCAAASPTIRTESGAQFQARTAVLAAGAWSGTIRGLPRALPVVPLKGQMLAVRGVVLRHGVMSSDVYLVPRDSETLIGATSEHAGFDATTTKSALDSLRAAAVALCPALRDCPVTRAWAGVRPATPDMLPILGREPSCSGLVYACGHSRNGILLAPATSQAIGALVADDEMPPGIDAFRVERFRAAVPSESESSGHYRGHA